MKTIVYIDGFNLYKAVLSKTPHKWLDLGHLFGERILHPIEPRTNLQRIKFFTARLKGCFCKDPHSVNRQDRYLRAIKQHAPDLLEIIEGKHVEVEAEGRHVAGNPPLERWLSVRKWEEKQTDVNIALSIYRDCAKRKCDQIVLVSNDSDLAPALAALREDFPEIKRGLVIPTKGRKSQTLIDLAHWTRDEIPANDLANAQLPEIIHYRAGRLGQKRKQLKKPQEW